MLLSEGKKAGDVVRYEAPALYSREQVTIPAGETVVIGSLLEVSGDNHVVCTTGASAAGIALTAASPGQGESAQVPMLRRHAVVDRAGIDFGGLDAAGITAAIAALLALGILVRTGPTYTTL